MAWAGARQGLRRLNPQPTITTRDAVGEAMAMLSRSARVVDLGAGGRRITPEVFTVDGDASSRPDLVCDLHAVPLPDASFDGAFCCGTLEHVRDADRVARELVRLVKPGGLVYIDVPFLQGFHADPHDYRRWTLPGLRLFCERLGLEEVASGVPSGPGSAVSWVVSEYVRIALGGGAVARALTLAARLLLRPLLWMDRWMVRKPQAHRLASGVFVIGRKPGAAPLAAGAA